MQLAIPTATLTYEAGEERALGRWYALSMNRIMHCVCFSIS